MAVASTRHTPRYAVRHRYSSSALHHVWVRKHIRQNVYRTNRLCRVCENIDPVLVWASFNYRLQNRNQLVSRCNPRGVGLKSRIQRKSRYTRLSSVCCVCARKVHFPFCVRSNEPGWAPKGSIILRPGRSTLITSAQIAEELGRLRPGQDASEVHCLRVLERIGEASPHPDPASD